MMIICKWVATFFPFFFIRLLELNFISYLKLCVVMLLLSAAERCLNGTWCVEFNLRVASWKWNVKTLWRIHRCWMDGEKVLQVRWIGISVTTEILLIILILLALLSSLILPLFSLSPYDKKLGVFYNWGGDLRKTIQKYSYDSYYSRLLLFLVHGFIEWMLQDALWMKSF